MLGHPLGHSNAQEWHENTSRKIAGVHFIRMTANSLEGLEWTTTQADLLEVPYRLLLFVTQE